MKILSVMWSHCATAAVVVDGEVVACVSEERFSRVKNDDGYPKRAIEAVLREAGVRPEELDAVALPGERFDPKYILCHHPTFSMQDRLREQHDYWLPRLYDNRDLNYLDVFKDKVDVEQYPGDWDDVVAFLREGEHKADEANRFFQDFRRR